MPPYDDMAAALDEGDEEAALRVLQEQPDLAWRRFVGDRQGGHSAALLLHAAELGMARVVQDLLSLGVSPDTFGGSGATALHYAASRGFPECVTCLLNARATVDMKCSTWGNTPLGWASSCEGTKVLECMQLLIDAGANPAVESSRGYTPLARAHLYEQLDKVSYLTSLGAPREFGAAAPPESPRAMPLMPDGLVLHLAFRDGCVVDLCGRELAVEGDSIPSQGRAGNTSIAFTDSSVA